MSGILIEGDAKNWMESGPIRDMLIQKNNFISCGISIQAPNQTPGPDQQAHENIRIVDNMFTAVKGAAVTARGVKGLVITGNKATDGTISLKVDNSCSEVKLADPAPQK